MKRRPLGKTGMPVSVLGIGDVADRSVPLGKCVATLQRALDYGLNLVDTAPGYENGYSEQIVGTALKGRRDGVFVIDKIDDLAAPVGPQVDASLRALDLDAVDLFAFHAVSKMSDWERIAAVGMAELARCQSAGKVRFRGISSHHPDVLRAALDSSLCDAVLFPVGPFVNRRYVEEIIPLARQKGVGTVCFKNVRRGQTARRYDGLQPAAGSASAREIQFRWQSGGGGDATAALGRGGMSALHPDAQSGCDFARHEFSQ